MANIPVPTENALNVKQQHKDATKKNLNIQLLWIDVLGMN